MPKEKRSWVARHKVLTGIGVLVILGVIGVATSDSSKQATTNTSGTAHNSQAAQPKKEAEKTIKLNEPATDGKFEFTVASVECGKPTVGTNQYLQKTAQGQYCLLNLTIKNVGDKAQTFDSSNVSLYDAAGAKFSADAVASGYANPDSSTFLNQINPGNSVTAAVVFDLPKDKTPVTAELHDGVFSRGVKVNLQ